MLEICKCKGEKCVVKEVCYRFVCEPHQFQQWAEYYLQAKNKKGECSMYLKNYGKRRGVKKVVKKVVDVIIKPIRKLKKSR